MKADVEKSVPPKEETIVEVELTAVQKQYYRAIYERNVDFLSSGSSHSPSLMNVVMELRKCCNHPYLITGAEAQIVATGKVPDKVEGKDLFGHHLVYAAGAPLTWFDRFSPVFLPILFFSFNFFFPIFPK